MKTQQKQIVQDVFVRWSLKTEPCVCVCWQVPRPLAMKKEGIQTRKRKPKNLNKSQTG